MEPIASNVYTTREEWLQGGIRLYSDYFSLCGYALPANIRAAIAFTSTGKGGRIAGECWHPALSDDGFYEIFIRPDMAEPVEVLTILIQQLVHTLLPSDEKLGKQYRAIATRLGLEGKMRHAVLGPVLKERVHAMAASLGPLPHAKLNFAAAIMDRKKQTIRYHKAECSVCGYTIRITAKWAKVALPRCPVDNAHGQLVCDLVDDKNEAG